MRAYLRIAFATLVFGSPLLGQASAADDIHCFSQKVQTEYEQALTIFDILGVDESELTDAQRIDMLAEYEQNGWSQRLMSTPWLDMKHNYGRSRVGKQLVWRAGSFHWLDAWTMMGIEYHAERLSRRTGSKYMYVPPELRRMARERGVTRSLMKKRKCHSSIAYLG